MPFLIFSSDMLCCDIFEQRLISYWDVWKRGLFSKSVEGPADIQD